MANGGVVARWRRHPEMSVHSVCPGLRVAAARAANWVCGCCLSWNLTSAFRGLFSIKHPADGEAAVIVSVLGLAASVRLSRLDQQ
jgi:hypothetical protein